MYKISHKNVFILNIDILVTDSFAVNHFTNNSDALKSCRKHVRRTLVFLEDSLLGRQFPEKICFTGGHFLGRTVSPKTVTKENYYH